MRSVAVATFLTAVTALSSFIFSPAHGQQCVAQFQSTAEQARSNLGQCAKRNRLMDSDPALVKLYQEVIEQKSAHDWTMAYYKQRGTADPSFTFLSPPNFKVTEPAVSDGRWIFDGTTIRANCSAPLSVQGQEESFLECARVYACALQASSCAVVEANRTKATDCTRVANQCLQRHRIPGMASLDSGPPSTSVPLTGVSPGAGTNTSARRTPPPQAGVVDGLSPACRAQLNQFLEAADRGQSAKATTAYESLRANCDGALRQLARQADMALPERQMGALSRGYFEKCLNGGDCGTAPSTPGQTAQAAANAFNVDEVLDFAFGLASFAVGVAGMYAPVPGGAITSSNRYSTMNQRARSTYGQGGPTYVAPRTVPSDITGTRR